MKIGVLVGKKQDGTFEYVGVPGNVDALKTKQRELTESGPYVKTWLSDAARGVIHAKGCNKVESGKKTATKK